MSAIVYAADQPVLAAVLGDVGGAQLGDLAGGHLGGVVAEDVHVAAGLATHAGDRLDELALAVALDAGDAEHLAAADVGGEAVDGLHAAVVEHPQIPHRQQHVARVGGGFSTRNTTSRPTMRLASDCCVAVAGSAVPATRPLRSTVIWSATASTSRQLVGDEDDRLALVDEAAHDGEEVVDLARGEHRRRLVEDQDVGPAVQRLDELHPLLLADREVADLGVGVDVEAVAVADLADLAAGAAHVEQPVLGRARCRARCSRRR